MSFYFLKRYVTSWIETRSIPAEKSNLVILFDKYTPACLEALRTRFKKVTPIPEIAHVQMLCFLLNCTLIPSNTPTDCPKEWHELYFVFCCIWVSCFETTLIMHEDRANIQTLTFV